MRSSPFRTTCNSRRATAGLPVVAFTLVALVLSGCGTMWDRVREQERMFALDSARTQTDRGQCASALQSLDRAEARIDLGPYAREATLSRQRCYEKIGQQEAAAAHRRLIDDFYTDQPMALPEPDGSSVFRVKALPSDGFERPPSWLEVPSPRYTPYAQRSKIVGRVVIAFDLNKNGRPQRIRVLEMNHPLLASWAIEAIASANPSMKDRRPHLLMPGGPFVTTFVFESHWAKEEPTSEFDS